ncbi:MAG: hypothetical protein U1E73_04775 [Planctomycetota bacterium]
MRHRLRSCPSLVALSFTAALTAQIGPPSSHWEPVAVQSGIHANTSPVDGVVHREFVAMPPGTPWLRLYFSKIWLGKDSYLRIASLRDGAEQTLTMEHVAQWQFSSAYFNGDTVLIELVAGAGTTKNYYEIDKVMVGDQGSGQGPDTICGTTDDRTPSSNPATGRIDPIGCTGWIIDWPQTGVDRLHLSAGHCYSTGVIEFDVPASGGNCAIQHPAPSKQFAIDTANSVHVNGGTGNDYWVFRCFPNSTTNLTTYQTQGAAFQFASPMPATGASLRIYGYGVDGTNTNNATGNSCVCATGTTGSRNQVQQTHSGPLAQISSTELDYVIDTCGGNSGSVVLENATGRAVAIHTNGGCDAGGGSNAGTAVSHPYLLVAIAAMAGPGGSVANDECYAATPVVDGVNGPFSNAGATTSAAFPCGNATTGLDVWFRYVATCSGATTFDTCSANRTVDTVLELFGGSCGGLNSLGCNDDFCSTGSSLTANLVAGVVYYVRVGGYGGAQGAFDLTITSCNAPDECTGAVPLQLGDNGPFGNTVATTSAPAWPCGTGTARDLWFAFQAPPATVVTFTTCSPGTDFDTVLQVFAGSCGGLTPLACNDDDLLCASSTVSSTATVTTTAAATLYVRVGGYNGATGSFVLNATQYPANDACTAAVGLVDGANGPFSNLGATRSSTWPCALGGSDVWFTYTAPRTGTMVVDTCAATRTFDTALEVFSGNCGSLVSRGCNDDACSLGSSLAVAVTQGQTYRIRMGGYNGAQGQATLTVATLPANDECTNAVPLALGVNGPFSNAGATTSAPAWPCGYATGTDVWFRYTATATAPITFWTCSPTRTFDTVLQVFQGDCNIMASMGCDDDFCALGSRVQINATQGATYYVRVGGFSSYTGAFDVEVQYGTGLGSIVRNTHGCGTTTIQSTGQPHIGGTVTTTLGNVTGVPFLGFGFVPGATSFCTCIVGHEWLTAMFGTLHHLNVPISAGLVGVTIAVQGADLMGTSGCPSPRVAFTDTMVITIG